MTRTPAEEGEASSTAIRAATSGEYSTSWAPLESVVACERLSLSYSQRMSSDDALK